MRELLRRTWAEINLDCAEHNYRLIKSHLDDHVKMMCVIKANAYGHGAVQLAGLYDRMGCDWFAVSNLEEAIQLRKAGFNQDILILGYTNPLCAGLLYEYNITQTVFSDEFAQRLNDEAAKQNVKINAHVKIDTGMTRLGFYVHSQSDISPACSEIQRISRMKNISLKGIFTHFAAADEKSGEQYTKDQYSMFTSVIDSLAQCGISFELRHCCNSAALMLYPQMHMDMVRPGIILYGLSPSDELREYWDLKPVMSLKSTVSLVKDVPPQVPVSYGRIYTTEKTSRIATVAVGYADGFPRLASNKAEMLINGKRVKTVGRVCMDQLMLDVSGVDGVHEGDTVTVFGGDNGQAISIDELSSLSGTINYETACDIGARVARIYIKDGREIGDISLLKG